jgi:mono/diheme cytochrome c family protein
MNFKSTLFGGAAAFLMVVLSQLACEQNTYRIGQRLYEGNCANCHMDAGEGLGELIPPLAGADYWAQNRALLPCILRHGLADTIVVNGKSYTQPMAGNSKLSDIQITNILNYVGNSWGNQTAPFRLDEVRTLLEQCERRGAK